MIDQDRPPNFRGVNGKLYLIRCFACDPERGRENYAIAVADGKCAWCGWSEADTETPPLFEEDGA